MNAKLGFLWIPVFALLSVSLVSCDSEEDSINQVSQLTEQEQTMLQFMREEEKLARDVYTHFAALYGLNIFENIAASEQKHTDFVLDLMDAYNLPDAGSAVAGTFNNPDLQSLYDALIALGEQSLLEALYVGATIEDVDIFDLQNAAAESDKSDLKALYAQLECGSRNHLRAFMDQITSRGGEYTPQYISQETFDQILESGHETCQNP